MFLIVMAKAVVYNSGRSHLVLSWENVLLLVILLLLVLLLLLLLLLLLI